MKILLIAMALATPTVAQVSDDTWARIQKDEAEQRAKNAETDFWLVSTTDVGLKQKRFYVDRNHLINSQEPGIAYGWLDMYEVVSAKRPIHLQHTKAIMEAACSGDPKIHFKTIVTYKPDGSMTSSSSPSPWEDVIPGSSMETLHRFFCHDEPANALQTMFNTTPEKDALAYYARQQR